MSDDVPARLAHLLQERGERFATAESVTAGLLADRTAQGPSASDWYLGGVVAWSTGVKQRLLGVQGEEVVNASTAAQMARGVAALLGADVAVATTGVGGPDPQEGQPAGTVFVGVLVGGEGGSVTTHRLQLDGDPEDVCTGAATAALALVVERLQEQAPPEAARSA